jgi:hypothetical protein
MAPASRSLRTSSRTLWRQTAWGVLFALILVAAPTAVRAGFGVSALAGWGWSQAFTEGAFIVVSLVSTTAAVDLAMRRHAPWRALIAVALGMSAVMTVLGYLLCRALADRYPSFALFESGEPHTMTYGLLAGVADAGLFCAMWSLVVLVPTLARTELLQRQQAEALLRESELLRLRTALAPHFMLNTLNTIAGLVTESPAEARRLLGELGDLMREIGDPAAAPTHPLGEEVAWLARYTGLLEARHGDQLRVSLAVPDDLAGRIVPRFVLQPLVENAVQHGALRRHGGGTVSLRARDEQGDLVVEVRNDGPAPVRESRDGGQGLDLVRQRLALAHPRAGVTLAREGGETVVRVRLPGREAA